MRETMLEKLRILAHDEAGRIDKRKVRLCLECDQVFWEEELVANRERVSCCPSCMSRRHVAIRADDDGRLSTVVFGVESSRETGE